MLNMFFLIRVSDLHGGIRVYWGRMPGIRVDEGDLHRVNIDSNSDWFSCNRIRDMGLLEE